MAPRELVLAGRPQLPGFPEAPELVELFLQGQNPNTQKVYALALKQFAAWAGFEDVRAGMRVFLSGAQGPANAAVLRWRTHMVEALGLAPKTVNTKLSALRAAVKLARQVGHTAWTLDVEDLPAEVLRDTRGPGVAVVRAMVARLEAQAPTDPSAARDLAVVRLLYDLALRRFEVTHLDLEHLDLKAGQLSVRGKGRRARQTLELPQPTLDALRVWLLHRGEELGPLFTAMGNRKAKDGRLGLDGVNRLVARRGQEAQADRKVRPHGLRHTAITDALDRTQGDVRRVRAFSRHANLQTLTYYDDARYDHAGDVAKIVAGGVRA